MTNPNPMTFHHTRFRPVLWTAVAGTMGLLATPVLQAQLEDAAGGKPQPGERLDRRLEAAPSDSADVEEANLTAEWIPLFNGEDLTGWTPKFADQELGVNYRDTFRVEDGKLVVSYENWDEWDGSFGHLFADGTYSHYRLRAEYRFVGDQIPGAPGWAFRNNGFMIHGQSAESMGVEQDFPTSIEVQMLGGNGTDPRSCGNICTPGTDVELNGERVTQHVIQSDGPTIHGDEWVTIEVEVHGGDLIRHYVNGELAIEYSAIQLDDGTPLSEGSISIQAETHGIEFRKIEILPLND